MSTSRPCLLLVAALLVAAGGPSCRRLPPGVSLGGERAQVELRDTLPGLIDGLQAGLARVPDGPREAWLAYESAAAGLLTAAGALPDDPGDGQLHKLAASPDALLALLRPVSEDGPGEARALVVALEEKLGQLPPMVLAFGASRERRPLFHGRLDGRRLVLVNARDPQWGVPGARRARLARELFFAWQHNRFSGGARLGPLAQAVWRDGAASLAARFSVPELREEELFDVEPKQLALLRSRQGLIARELLSALDSASEAEAARFFSEAVKDPLLPRGAGPFIADRLFQRLAADHGSVVRPLQLTPAEFLQRARPALQSLVNEPPR